MQEKVTLSHVVISGFYARALGGALFIMDSGILEIKHTLFAACAVAHSRVSFRGVLSYDPDAEPNESLSKDGPQEKGGNSEGSYGGALSAVNTESLEMFDVIFEHNSAPKGGALAIMGHESLQNSL